MVVDFWTFVCSFPVPLPESSHVLISRTLVMVLSWLQLSWLALRLDGFGVILWVHVNSHWLHNQHLYCITSWGIELGFYLKKREFYASQYKSGRWTVSTFIWKILLGLIWNLSINLHENPLQYLITLVSTRFAPFVNTFFRICKTTHQIE